MQPRGGFSGDDIAGAIGTLVEPLLVRMKLLETSRLLLRPLTRDDAAFILELVNEPDWLRFIGDRQVRTLEDARRYLNRGPLEAYARLGFGHAAVVRRADGVLLGICGLIKRDTLADVDLGFAFLAQYRGQGYAREAAAAVLADAWGRLKLTRIVAITSPGNVASAGLLARLGFQFERRIRLTPTAEETELFARGLEGWAGAEA